MTREALVPEFGDYLENLVPPRPAELADMEEIAKKLGFPIIGPACGQFCYLAARTLGARSVFELGSGFGYSTAWFAQAVRDNGGGVVHHVVWDEKLSKRAKQHLQALGLIEYVEFHVGEAVSVLRETGGTFDLIFNDIDKHGYPASLPVIRDHLRSGGLMIVDNLLWHGGVLDPEDDSDNTKGVRELTRLVMADPAWTASIVPLRDGMMIARKS